MRARRHEMALVAVSAAMIVVAGCGVEGRLGGEDVTTPTSAPTTPAPIAGAPTTTGPVQAAPTVAPATTTSAPTASPSPAAATPAPSDQLAHTL